MLPDFADLHIILNHDKANLADLAISVKNSKVNVDVADLIYSKCIPEQRDLVDFPFAVDILWNYGMPNA